MGGSPCQRSVKKKKKRGVRNNLEWQPRRRVLAYMGRRLDEFSGYLGAGECWMTNRKLRTLPEQVCVVFLLFFFSFPEWWFSSVTYFSRWQLHPSAYTNWEPGGRYIDWGLPCPSFCFCCSTLFAVKERKHTGSLGHRWKQVHSLF